jgi:hypothetical protein
VFRVLYHKFHARNLACKSVTTFQLCICLFNSNFIVYLFACINHTFSVLFLLQWDSKITTPPGLYAISLLALTPYFWIQGIVDCNIFNLRLVNVLATTLNFVLLVLVKQKLLYKKVNEGLISLCYQFLFYYYLSFDIEGSIILYLRLIH